MPEGDYLRSFALTDVGCVRKNNEDQFLVDRKLALYIVADGMGGHASGEIASWLAVRTVHEELKKQSSMITDYLAGLMGVSTVTDREILNLLEFAVRTACRKIHETAEAEPEKRGMGTTLSALLVAKDRGFIAHVGDSRIYLQRGGSVEQITEDHTVINELLKRGRLSPEQIAKVASKNAITRAVGVYEQVDVDTLAIDVLPGDRFLLCSDGLHGYLQNEMLEAFLDAQPDPEGQVKRLIEFAKSEGGKDNITVIAVHVEENEQERVRVARVKAKRATMRQVKLFSKVGEHDLLRLMQVAEIRDYKAGDVVMREGDPGEELFVVLSGKVDVKKGEALLATLGPGEHVGEMSLIRSAPRSATVIASMPCEMVVIHQRDFAEMIQREPRLAISVLREFLLVLADRLDHTSRDLQTAKDLAKNPAPERRSSAEVVDLTDSAVLEETPRPGTVSNKQ